MLETFTEACKQQYIQEHLGEDILRKAQSIHRGGENAAKGQKYESLFMLFKVIEVASNTVVNNQGKHRFSRQGLDFFDDVCYEDFETNTKHNYQAKNSALDAANWNDEHKQRAKLQIQMDVDFHRAQSSQNYLVVSSEEKHQRNIEKIPAELEDNCHSIYFPYYGQFQEFVEKQLSEMLEKLTCSNDASDHEYAANLLLGLLTNNDEPRTLEAIFNSAKSKGYPNPFDKVEKPLPTWLTSLLKNNQQITYQVQGAYLIVKIKQFELKIPIVEIIDMEEPNSLEISDVSSLIQLLMNISAKSLMGNA